MTDHHIGKLFGESICFCIDKKSRKRMEKQYKKMALQSDFVQTNNMSKAVEQVVSRIITQNKSRAKCTRKNILLSTDDAMSCAAPLISEMPPDDWDILFFGGHVVSIREHTTEHWKRGIYASCSFVVLSHKILSRVHKEIQKHMRLRTWSYILEQLQNDDNIHAYCYSPQFIGSFRAAANGQTGITNMTQTPESFYVVPSASCSASCSASPASPTSPTSPHCDIFVLVTPNPDMPKRGYIFWEQLLYMYANAYHEYKNKLKMIIGLPENYDEKISNSISLFASSLPQDAITTYIFPKEKYEEAANSYGHCLQMLVDYVRSTTFEMQPSESLFAIWDPSYVYSPDYFDQAFSFFDTCPDHIICGATRTVIFEAKHTDTRYLVPTDVNGHEIILDPAQCIWRGSCTTTISSAPTNNPMLAFSKNIGFEKVCSYSPDKAARIVLSTNIWDNLEEQGCPKMKDILGASNIDFFQNTLDLLAKMMEN